MGLFMSWLFYYLIPMAEGHISWGPWLGPRAYDHFCVWQPLSSLLPSRRGFIALAQKLNTNEIINHSILRGQAKAFQIITNNTTLGKKMKFYSISIFLLGITSMEATSVSNLTRTPKKMKHYHHMFPR